LVKRAWKLDASADPLLDFLLRGSFASFATRVAGVALSYGSAVLLSRTLGVSGYGVYSVALGWALVLVLPSRAGLDYAALRFGAYLEEGAIERLRGFFRFSASVVFGVSVVAGAALYLVTGLGLTSMRPSMAPGVGLLIFPIAALGLAGALLRTARKIAAGQFYDQILRPAGLIAGLAAAALAGLRLSPANAMVFTAVGAFVALAFALVHVARATGALQGVADYGPWRSWLALSFPLLLTSMIQELLNQLDIILPAQMRLSSQKGACCDCSTITNIRKPGSLLPSAFCTLPSFKNRNIAR